jgi:hypothetical protein
MNKLIEAMVRHDEPSNIGDPDIESIADIVRQIKDRFVDERVNGFVDPRTGQQQPPVSREEAEQRWHKILPQVQKVMLSVPQNDSAQKRLRPNKRTPLPASSTYTSSGEGNPEPGEPINPDDLPPDPAARAERAMQAEPALRRGESKTSRILSKLLA